MSGLLSTYYYVISTFLRLLEQYLIVIFLPINPLIFIMHFSFNFRNAITPQKARYIFLDLNLPYPHVQ